MLINLRNALMAGKRLPYDAEVEYLKSSGTQWINTGYYPNNNTKLQYRCFSASSGTACGCMNGIGWKPSFSLVFYTGVSPRWGTDTNTSYTPFTWANVDITVEQDKDCYLNGQLVRSYTDTQFQMQYPLIVFDRSELNNNHDPYEGKVYYLKIFENGVLVRDFIPVRKGTVGYLYDRVSGKLFGNAGTGDFVLGQDVVPVEYIESHGTEWIDTGVNAKQSLKIRAVFETNSTTSYFIYGVRAGDTTITCASGNSLSLGYLRWGTSAFARAIPTGLVDITQDSSGGIVNGTSYSYSATQTVVEQSGYTMVVFAGRNSATTVTSNMVGKFYSCKIWNNSLPVRSFLSVRVGTEGAMMDVLTRRIYRNAGTGAFTYGNDLKYPIPAE